MSHLDTYFFFVNATATTEIYTLSLHDALPISVAYPLQSIALTFVFLPVLGLGGANFAVFTIWLPEQYPTRMRATAFAFTTDRKSTRLNSSHMSISYAVFCLKKKNQHIKCKQQI